MTVYIHTEHAVSPIVLTPSVLTHQDTEHFATAQENDARHTVTHSHKISSFSCVLICSLLDIFFLPFVKCSSMFFLSAVFLHTSTDCSHFFQCCHIGIGSSLQQKSHPRYRIATFIQLGSGAMVSVEQANEIVTKLRERETEQSIVKDLVHTSQSGSDVKLNFRYAGRHVPGMFDGGHKIH